MKAMQAGKRWTMVDTDRLLKFSFIGELVPHRSPQQLGVLTVISLQQSALLGINSVAKSLLGEGVGLFLGSLHPKLIYEELKSQTIGLTWNNSEGIPNAQTSHVTNCSCHWACIMTQLISPPNHPFPPQFHRYWLQEHSLVNILQAKLCFRVSFLGYPICAHVNQSSDLYKYPSWWQYIQFI